MISWKPFVELKTNTGSPIEREGMIITPQAQALTIRFPYGGFVWNRPVAVLVERKGRRERIPIFDVTRATVLGMIGASMALSMVMILTRIVWRGTAEV